MGKGKRTQDSAEFERNLATEKAAVLKKQQRKNKIVSALITAGIIAFGVLAVASSVLYSNLSENGWFARQKTVVATKHYKANLCMTQYVFETLVDQFEQNYGENLEEMGLNTAEDLRTQECTYEGYDTWYDYFTDSAKSQLSEILVLCEAAKAEGIELTDGDNRFIENSIKSLSTLAEDEGLEFEDYIDENYGTWVNADDIKKCLELTQLASRYHQKYYSSLSYTDSKIDSYFTDNKGEFLSADYVYFLIETGDTTNKTDSEITQLKLEAEKTAKSIAKAKSHTDFINNLTEYTEKLLKDASPNATAEEIKEQAETVISDYATVTDAPYDVSTKNGEWLFDQKRKAGDTAVIEDEEGNGYYVFYLTTPAAKNTEETRNVRHILFSADQYDSTEDCEAAAEKALLEWRNGKKNEASFAKLAELYTHDSGSITNGGLYENVLKGQMVKEFDSWIFNQKREYGDTEVISTDYGYHVMFYVGEGDTAWKAEVISALKAKDYSDYLEKQRETHKLKVKENNLKSVTQTVTEENEAEEE